MVIVAIDAPLRGSRHFRTIPGLAPEKVKPLNRFYAQFRGEFVPVDNTETLYAQFCSKQFARWLGSIRLTTLLNLTN